MKKFDLHIHTIASVLDKPLDFKLEVLEAYVKETSLDCIAITNHNLFDREQFELIVKKLEGVVVFPGIEITLEHGHLILISPQEEITTFNEQCKLISTKLRTRTDSLTLAEFHSVFPHLERYLLIPHYDKNPELPRRVVMELRKDIKCGEVQSVKKFCSLMKSKDELTPVLFSDFRITDQECEFPTRFTFINVDEISVQAIRTALTDKTKVSLSSSGQRDLVQVLGNGLKISTGLTIILGERSSGKTYTLDLIAKTFTNPKYIKQFELLSKSDEKDEAQFSASIRESQDEVAKAFLAPFQHVVDDAKGISLETNEKDFDDYLLKLLQSGAEAYREDAFSKMRLYHETLFNLADLVSLENIINSVEVLVENTQYRELINKYISELDLVHLLIAMMENYIAEYEQNLMMCYANDLINAIQYELSLRSAMVTVPEIDFYKYLLDKKKIELFIKIANNIKESRIICEKDLSPYRIVIRTRSFSSTQELKKYNKSQLSLSDVFRLYDSPYKYLRKLVETGGLLTSDIYLYFVCIECSVLNEHGFQASGGERSEFNLIRQLSNAIQYDILLIDEPESSFDNMFLSRNINRLLKEISDIMPVVISTHNSTLGASSKPDYLIYTKRQLLDDGKIEFLIYSGHPLNKELVELRGSKIQNQVVHLDCLEAGKERYYERKDVYENLKN